MTRRESSKGSWDPLLIICQIIALQACHYLALCLVTPPLLVTFADPLALSLEGGPSNVAMVMDWREMVGRATIEERIGEYTRLPPSLGRQSHTLNNDNILEHIGKDGLVHPKPAALQDDPFALLRHTQEQQRKQSEAAQRGDDQGYAYAAADPKRGWVLGAAWIIASSIDIVYIYHIIRRPTHILDFSLTLAINHIILTTYYASSFPTSLFFWAILAGSAAFQIIWAEQLCVRREMKEGFHVGQGWKTDERNEDALPTFVNGRSGAGGPPSSSSQNGRPKMPRRNSAPSSTGQYERIPMQDMG